MHRLQNLSSLCAGAAFSLRRRLLCNTTTSTSPAGFVAESYLVANCGLTPSQALKASKSLSRLKSPDQADAVRAFLADLSLSEADVASTITRRPRLLCCSVEETLAPRASQLRDMGLSTPEIARLVLLAPCVLVSPGCVSRLAFYMSFLGSFTKVHAAMRCNSNLLNSSLERVVEPNIALLRQCGLPVRAIAQVLVLIPRLLVGSQDRIKAVIARAEELGVPQGTPMFRHALVVAENIRPATATAKMELLKSLGWSSSQVAMTVARMPSVVGTSEDRLRRAVEFLTREVGMEVEAIARAPSLLKYSIEGRLAPRLKVLKLLKEKGSPLGDRGFYVAACMTNEMFIKTYVRPLEEIVPPGTDVYAAARAGKAPAGAA